MNLIGACHDRRVEARDAELLARIWHLFPNIPAQSGFNWRRRNPMQAINCAAK